MITLNKSLVVRNDIKINKLNDNITIISEIKNTQQVGVGFCAIAGSRNETDINNGVAHFLEHISYYGSKKYSSTEISNILQEKYSGCSNAYTSWDETVYHGTGLISIQESQRDVLGKVSDVIYEVFKGVNFSSQDIERERNVIIQEYNKYIDDNFSYIHEELIMAIHKDSSIGRRILGTRESINSINSDMLYQFKQENYGNIVISVTGNIPHEVVVDVMKDVLKDHKYISKEVDHITWNESRIVKVREDLSESIITVVWKVNNYNTVRNKIIHDIIENILVARDNSRFMKTLREDKGYIYGISGWYSYVKGGCTFTAMWGIESKNIMDSLNCIKNIIETISIDNDELQRIKEMILCNMIKEQEQSDTMMHNLKSYLLYGSTSPTIQETVDVLNYITPEDVKLEILNLVNPVGIGIYTNKYVDISSYWKS